MRLAKPFVAPEDEPMTTAEKRTIKLKRLPLVENSVGFFRFGKVAGRNLITNDAGRWHFLDDEAFADLLGGRIAAGHPQFEALRDKGFIRHDKLVENRRPRTGR